MKTRLRNGKLLLWEVVDDKNQEALCIDGIAILHSQHLFLLIEQNGPDFFLAYPEKILIHRAGAKLGYNGDHVGFANNTETSAPSSWGQ